MENQLTFSAAAAPRKRWYQNQQRRDEIVWGIALLIPIIVLAIVFNVYPIFRSIEITLYNWTGIGKPTQFVGLRHFINITKDPIWWAAFRNSLWYAAVQVPVQLTLALVLAIVLNNEKLKARLLYRGLYFLPTICNVAIMAIVLRIMFSQFGVTLSTSIGLEPIDPVGDIRFAMWSVILFGIWQSLGYNLVYFLAAIQTVPSERYDAAKVDGANWLQEIIHVTIPGIWPIMTIILFMAVLGSLNVFEASFVLTGGGPYHSSEVVGVYIYNYAFGGGGYSGKSANLGYASAASLFMSLIVLSISAVQLIVTRARNK